MTQAIALLMFLLAFPVSASTDSPSVTRAIDELKRFAAPSGEKLQGKLSNGVPCLIQFALADTDRSISFGARLNAPLTFSSYNDLVFSLSRPGLPASLEDSEEQARKNFQILDLDVSSRHIFVRVLKLKGDHVIQHPYSISISMEHDTRGSVTSVEIQDRDGTNRCEELFRGQR